MSSFDSFLTRWAKWPVIVVLALLSAFIMLVLFPMATPSSPGAPQPPLDTHIWYTAAEVTSTLDALTPAQRNAAAWMHLSLDVLYPLVYGTLMALLLKRAWPQRRMWRLAIAVVAADLMENILLATLYWTHPRDVTTLTPLAAGWTALKWTLVALAVVLALGGALQQRRGTPA